MTDALDAAKPTEDLGDRQFTTISRALADPRRYSILSEIAASDGALRCSCLNQSGKVTAATISHHLKELETAGLIEILREGKFAKLIFRRATFEAYRKRLAQL